MNGLLDATKSDQTQIRKREDQHDRQLNNDWDSDLKAVTETPSSELQGVTFRDVNASSALKSLVPGATPWDDYHTEYLASADSTLMTLRTSLDALYAHNQQIERSTALDRIARLAGQVGDRGTNGKGFLAMDELEVQSSLEVARQLHALRAQHALRATIYATAESHRVGAEARSRAENEEVNCRILASALTGIAGVALSC